MVEGVYVETLLRGGAFPPRAALEMLSAVCQGLESVELPTSITITPTTVCIDSTGQVRLSGASGDPAEDALAIGRLLTALILGALPAPLSAEPRERTGMLDGLMREIDQTLSEAGGDWEWRRDVLLLMKATMSSDPALRPDPGQLIRQCRLLQEHAPGVGLLMAMGRTRPASGDEWLDFEPASTDQVGELESMLSDALQGTSSGTPPAAAVHAANPSAPRRIHKAEPIGKVKSARNPIPVIIGAVVVIGLIALVSSREPEPEPEPEPPSLTASQIREAYLMEVEEAEPDVYQLSLHSVPTGATVLIDGVEIGETDLVELPLDPGVHHVLLKLKGRQFERAMEVGRRMQCTWDLEGETEWYCEVLEK